MAGSSVDSARATPSVEAALRDVETAQQQIQLGAAVSRNTIALVMVVLFCLFVGIMAFTLIYPALIGEMEWKDTHAGLLDVLKTAVLPLTLAVISFYQGQRS